ncbi:aryl-alcohol dehydrogenase-like predicted oxidoreductase [Cytobacillus firmus]|uniref:Aryl-alcohol dehydrogenase-like predicted oxidoreductase n=2 Tax=Cytobacillus TaxID=2675230 RepID=A0A366JNM1_CYTFI|nr:MULTISPECIES: aldo/keto reductase [Cytobacillus]RBP89509.1 aryl-alcohol dehydrogenase-like predicted oxidoreductase [Cytobacillus firmus]TDX47264.1 aryl-alcohol dehydrogenase-like predicted oxidoreductase [Cytobacillus oceanisediminis]
MKKRRLGNSDLYVSELGLGCMSIGTNPSQAQEIIEAALEEGINYFDTANLYDFGENEKLVGQSLKSVREQVIIATKAGNRWNKNKDGWSWDPSKSHIKEAVKDSLKRLGTDYIDLYQLHGGTIEDPIDDTIEAFEELKEEGYIRQYGISSIRPNVIREYAAKSSIVSVMMQYSILDRRPEEEALPLLNQKGISAITRGPLAKGMLSNKMLDKASESVKAKGYLDYSYSELEKSISSIREIISDERSMTEIAFQYNLADHAVASVAAGASRAEQVRENAKAARAHPLNKDELALIKSIAKLNKYEQHR